MANNSENPNKYDLGGDLRHAINRHGHAFQNAVLRRAGELFENRSSKWIFDGVEIPVEVRGHSTRIDFLLHKRSWMQNGVAQFLIAECKRANPALSNWCFARSKFLRRNLEVDREPIVETVHFDGQDFTSEAQKLSSRGEVYALGYAVRADKKGEGNPGRDAIEEACGQVLRGVSGFVHLLRSAPRFLIVKNPTPLIPVVFTTANLWTTDAELSEADLSSGELPNDLAVQAVPWVWYRYHMSPGLRHEITATGGVREIGEMVEQLFVRTVAIVSPAGVDAFLTTEH
ncbi:MAG TPA: hypothetical protein VF006_15480 [Longimicrobium sp.]